MFGFRRRSPTQIWLFRTDGSPWVKIVVSKTPKWPYAHLVGPFRSETDAEQAADRLNAVRDDSFLFYDDEIAANESVDEEFEGPVDDEGEEWKRAGG
jgi:hypothetical protein